VRGCDAPAFKFAPNIVGSEVKAGCCYVSNNVYGVLPPIGVGVYGDIYQSLVAQFGTGVHFVLPFTVMVCG